MYTGQPAKISGVYREKQLNRSLTAHHPRHKTTISKHPQLTNAPACPQQNPRAPTEKSAESPPPHTRSQRKPRPSGHTFSLPPRMIVSAPHQSHRSLSMVAQERLAGRNDTDCTPRKFHPPITIRPAAHNKGCPEFRDQRKSPHSTQHALDMKRLNAPASIGNNVHDHPMEAHRRRLAPVPG
jgi:hypothetical protein